MASIFVDEFSSIPQGENLPCLGVVDAVPSSAGIVAQRIPLMEEVLNLVAEQGIWVLAVVYNEVEYFFGNLGLDDWYFRHYTASQIAAHIQCYLASKKLGQTTGDYTIQFHTQTQDKAFYLTTIGPDMHPFQQTEQHLVQWLNKVPEGYAYSMTYVESSGAAFQGREGRLAMFIAETCPFPSDPLAEGEDRIDVLATPAFLRNKRPQHRGNYQQLVRNVLQSGTDSWVGLRPVDTLDVPAWWGDCLLQLGIRQRQPVLLEQFSLVLERLGLQSHKRHIETFRNGITCYHFYCDHVAAEQVEDCLRAIQLVPYMKPSPLSCLFLRNTICSDALIYLRCAVKFAFHFVQKDTREYLALAQALAHDPSSKEKLDRLYLQSIAGLLTEDRVIETVLRYPELCGQLYTDFRAIVLQGRERFHNKEVAKQVEGIRDETDAKVLGAMLNFNAHLTGTNFFRHGGTPSSLVFRFDPSFLHHVSRSIFPEMPHTMFMIVGRSFYGFHIRFRDVARGGIRVIKSRDAATYRHNAATLFEECYNLALTQQRKNKDIPEGGAKGTILLDIDAQDRVKESFIHYVEALLDCMLSDKVGIHCPQPDILFFGPDENTAELMAVGSTLAHHRGYPLWKSLTTGKPMALGGIPHDVYGMTTRSVHTFKTELLAVLGLREEDMTKVQTGGPDGDLGSNEIKVSRDHTIAIVDGSGVAYDPAGLDRAELLGLANKRAPIGNFNADLLGPGGFLVRVGDCNVTLPDGTVVSRGDSFRDSFHLSAYATADLFVPCGGRPKAVTSDNVQLMFANGQPKFKYIVEGANLFFTDGARKVLEDAGVHVLKDASTNKGGVTSSSLEVLAALVMPAEDYEALLCVPPGGPIPEFYEQYVNHVKDIIAERARLEFRCLWQEKLRDPKAYYTVATERLSAKINALRDVISAEVISEPDLVRAVLQRCIPALLLDRYGVDHIVRTLPPNYLRATIAAWVAAQYVYRHGFSANEYTFHTFLRRLQDEGASPSTPSA